RIAVSYATIWGSCGAKETWGPHISLIIKIYSKTTVEVGLDEIDEQSQAPEMGKAMPSVRRPTRSTITNLIGDYRPGIATEEPVPRMHATRLVRAEVEAHLYLMNEKTPGILQPCPNGSG
ncbi:hypothetical protein ACWGTO_32630, partial [Mesorhizobium sp. PL10]